MPRVPNYDGQQVAERGIPVPQQSTISTSASNGYESLGKSITQAITEIDKQQQYANELRADEAVNQMRDVQIDLTLGQNGYQNARGKNALGIVPQYQQQFDAAAEKIAETLANDEQKQYFKRYVTRIGQEFRSGLMGHSNREAVGFLKDQTQGTIDVESDVAAKTYNLDPIKDDNGVSVSRVDMSRARIDNALSKIRDNDGLSADAFADLRLKALTKMHLGVVNAMLEAKQIDKAKEHLDTYGSEIESNTLAKARSELKREGNLQEAFKGAQSAVAPAIRSMQPGDMDRILHITAGAESGGRDFKADGSPVVSPTGVKWKMQVTDSTAQNPGYGIKPAQSKTPEEYNRVGEELLAKLLQKNGGDPAKMWAGYNGGQKYVDQAVEAAAKSGKSWVDELPGMIKAGEARGEVPKGKAEETLAYVRKNMAALDAGLGAPKRETFADVDARLQKQYADRPEVYKQAREFAKQQFDENEQAIKKNQEELFGLAQKALLANGGNFAALPASLRNQDPSKIDDLMKLATTIKKGEPTITNPALYLKLSDENYLKSLSEGQLFAFRKDLSEQDYQHFAAQHGRLHGQSIKETQDINTAALNNALSNRLTPYKMDMTPKDGSDEAARLGAIRQFVTRSVLDAQAASGHKMTDAEMIKHVDGLLATSTKLRGFFGGTSTMATLLMKPGDVPTDFKDTMKSLAKKNGDPEPSDTDILQMYWLKKFSPQSALKQAKAPQQPTATEPAKQEAPKAVAAASTPQVKAPAPTATPAASSAATMTVPASAPTVSTKMHTGAYEGFDKNGNRIEKVDQKAVASAKSEFEKAQADYDAGKQNGLNRAMMIGLESRLNHARSRYEDLTKKS